MMRMRRRRRSIDAVYRGENSHLKSEYGETTSVLHSLQFAVALSDGVLSKFHAWRLYFSAFWMTDIYPSDSMDDRFYTI